MDNPLEVYVRTRGVPSLAAGPANVHACGLEARMDVPARSDWTLTEKHPGTYGTKGG